MKIIYNKIIFPLLFISFFSPMLSFGMECRQCDSNRDNCTPVDCKTDPCDGGNNSYYCNKYMDGREECFSCNSNNDLHCESGYVGSANSGNIRISINGFPCTSSEMLEATALFGNWTKASNNPVSTDKILQGSQIIIMGIIQIFRKFNSDQGIYKGMGQFKMDCAMEYISRTCRLENVNHYCFADWNANQDGDPRLRWKSEDERQKVAAMIKKLKEDGNI